MKKKFYSFTFLAMVFMMLLSLVSCSKLQDVLNPNDDEDDPGDSDDDNTELVEGTMTDMQLSGLIRDVEGNPLDGVTITTGNAVATSDAEGLFGFSNVEVVDGRTVVRFSKAGYFDVVRSYDFVVEQQWEVVMCKKEANSFVTTKDYNSSIAQTLQVGGMKIEMPADGYKLDETGTAYSGQVKTDMLYLSPNNENFAEMMPGGDLAAVRTDKSRVTLVSYGMSDLNMYSSTGEKLQLKKGSKAKLTFPVPDGMSENLPASIPLWSFNEKKGLWEEEGSATLQGNVYVGEVSHFSWVNLDYPEKQAVVNGHVKDENGNPLPGVRLNIGQLQTPVYTDNNGFYRQVVPAKEDFKITVKPSYYGNYKNAVSLQVKGLEPKEVRTVDLVLPHLVRVYGTIVNDAADDNIASLWIETGKGATTKTQANKYGNFSIYVPENLKGDATIFARSATGKKISKKLVLANEDVNVGQLTFSADGSGATTLYVETTYGVVGFPIKETSDPMSGVMVVDGLLTYVTSEEAQVGAQIDVPNYEEGKLKYDNGVKVILNNSRTNEIFQNDGTKSMTCEVKRDGQKFNFNLNGVGIYGNTETDDIDENAKLKAENLSFNLFFMGKTLRNAKPSEVGFPAFTPELSAKAPIGLQITESRFGKGGMVFYNGGKNDYLALKNAMASQKGFTNLGEDNEDGDMYVIFYSASKKALVTIEFDSMASGVQDDMSWEDASDKAPIYMTVFDDVSKDMLERMMADDMSVQSRVGKVLQGKFTRLFKGKVQRKR